MIPIIKTTSYSGLREQIFANLKTCFPTQFKEFEIITADKSGRKTAWIVDTVAATTAVMKGPPCTTSEEALEGLLETTSVLVGQMLENVFDDFHVVPSEMVGEGFVREDEINFIRVLRAGGEDIGLNETEEVNGGSAGDG